MNKSIITIVSCLVGVFAASSVFAKSTEEDLAIKLKQRYPKMSIGAVNESAVAGIYEVIAGRDIVYTDNSGRFFFSGSIIDVEAKKDITAMRREAISRVDVRRLSVSDSFVTVRGNGRRTLYVFSDPDCPYCKQLEAQLEKLDDVTIYTFMLPISSLHSDAARKAESIWCEGSNDARALRWKSVVVKAESISSRSCDNPVKRNIEMAAALRIQGTPSLISADGRMRAGSAEAGAITQWMRLGDPPAP